LQFELKLNCKNNFIFWDKLLHNRIRCLRAPHYEGKPLLFTIQTPV